MTAMNNFAPTAKSHFLHARWDLTGAFLTHHIPNLAEWIMNAVFVLYEKLDNEFLGKEEFMDVLARKIRSKGTCIKIREVRLWGRGTRWLRHVANFPISP